MPRRLGDLLGPVLDQVANRVHELELVVEQLRRRDLLHLSDEVRGSRDQRGIGVGQRLVTAEDDEVFATHGNQRRVLCPVRTDDADRLVVAVDARRPARAVDPRGEGLLVGQSGQRCRSIPHRGRCRR